MSDVKTYQAQQIVATFDDEDCDAFLAALFARADRDHPGWDLVHPRLSAPALPAAPRSRWQTIRGGRGWPVLSEAGAVAVMLVTFTTMLLILKASWTAVVWLAAIGVVALVVLLFFAMLADARHVRDFWSGHVDP